MNRLVSVTKKLDWWLIIPTVYLVSLSFVIQHAILFKTKGLNVSFDLTPHFVAIFLAIAVAILASYFRPIKWQKVLIPTYVISVIMLIILLIIPSNDAERWIDFAGLRFQPTEIIKLAAIGVSAGLMAKLNQSGQNFLSALYSFLLMMLPAGLIAMQPDLGSSIVFFGIWIMMMIASSVRLSSLAIAGIAIFILFILSLPLLAPYQQDRISSFINPGEDSQGTSYNSIQAGIAIGSGGLLGRGLDSGTQSQLNFLPAQHTDFAFAVTAEKLGLVGALTVVIAMTVIMIRMTYLAWLSNNPYWRLLLVGLIGLFLSHSLINIGMNTGLLPVTGLPLPFLSYGGTFMFSSLTGVMLAVILSYYVRSESDSSKQALQG